MLADFTIHIHSEKPRAVQVKVYKTTAALRSAVTQYENKTGKKRKKNAPTEPAVGVCHRFHLQRPKKDGGWETNPLCAIVRLAPPYIGIGVVSHEMAHAAVWINELDNEFNDSLNCSNDEPFAWNLGELVRQTAEQLYEKGIWET